MTLDGQRLQVLSESGVKFEQKESLLYNLAEPLATAANGTEAMCFTSHCSTFI